MARKSTHGVIGAKDLQKKLAAIPAKVTTLVQEQIAITALSIESSAKEFVRVDTGRLRSSINTDFAKDRLSATVGTNVEYAEAQEFGLMNPNYGHSPFLLPAFELHKNGLLKNIQLTLKNGIYQM